ncbi:MAG TPA: phosphomannomutase CpsG [Steroidobacteraceae bacterium]|nr:phosphomannomutase CpsG [Steroidobacteraceae bacterium]
MNLSAFKAYDIRGRIPDELNPELVYQVGRAYAAFVKPKRVCVGRDIRLTSDQFATELIRGLTDAGVDVLDIGLCGTEGVYFATFAWKLDGGIMVTASHNPPDYNGLKLVREQSKPIGADSGLKDIAAMIQGGKIPPVAAARGKVTKLETSDKYIEHLLGYIDLKGLRKLKVVVDAGNGGAGLAVDKLEPHLPFEFIKVRHEPNGDFPQGVPNPMLEENRGPTLAALKTSRADVGIAWDGDYDRCFFYDSKGSFIEGYYIVGLLAEAFLAKQPGARIVYDPRLTWNTIDTVKRLGGVPVMSKSGHAFIKQKMREVDGAYGGEMSAHHYFRDFSYCDSGMIPWLLVLERVCESGKSLDELVAERIKAFPSSGEINRKLPDARKVLAEAEAKYGKGAEAVDHTDGLSVEFKDWRFNVRASNTEPLVRLNVESRGSESLMREKTADLLAFLDGMGAIKSNH